MARQTFEFGGIRWDVDEALALVAASPRSIMLVPVAKAAAMLWMIRFDPEWAFERADLSEPILLAPTPIGGSLVIDGWHRVARADRDGVEFLPGLQLTDDEEKQIRMRGTWAA